MSLHRHIKAQGRLRLQTVNPVNRRVVKDTGWIPNLLLNQGMDGVATRYWADSFTSAALGTSDALPLKISGGATTISQSNVTVTLFGGSFTFSAPADNGKVIKFGSGQTANIVAVTSPSTATVNTSAIIGDTTFQIYQTTQTGLQTEVQRSNTYYTGLGGCATVLGAPDTVVLRRSFEFGVEVAPVTYREVGVSWTNTPGSNLFSRIILPVPQSVSTGYRVRLVYELTLSLSPASSTARSVAIDGWPIAPATTTASTESMEDWGLAVVNSLGGTEVYRTVSGIPILANEPSAGADFLVGTDVQALGSPGDAVKNRWAANSYAAVTLPVAYIPGSNTRTRSAVVPNNEANSTNIRVICIGHIITPTDFLPVVTLLFDEAQTKDGSFFLGVNFRLSWGRSLL